MHNRNASLAGVLASFVLSITGTADIIPTAQERVVDVSAYSSDGWNQQALFAPDSGPFLATIEKTSSGPFGEHAAARAFQRSTISGSALVAEGYANATASAGGSSAFALGRAESRYRVEFAVGVSTDIRIVGALHARHDGNAPNTGQARLELKNLATQAVIASGMAISSGPTDVSLDLARTLEPGMYQFLVEAKGWADGYAVGQGFSNVFTGYEAQLTVVPAPGALAFLGGAALLVPGRRRLSAVFHVPGAGTTITLTLGPAEWYFAKASRISSPVNAANSAGAPRMSSRLCPR